MAANERTAVLDQGEAADEVQEPLQGEGCDFETQIVGFIQEQVGDGSGVVQLAGHKGTPSTTICSRTEQNPSSERAVSPAKARRLARERFAGRLQPGSARVNCRSACPVSLSSSKLRHQPETAVIGFDSMRFRCALSGIWLAWLETKRATLRGRPPAATLSARITWRSASKRCPRRNA